MDALSCTMAFLKYRQHVLHLMQQFFRQPVRMVRSIGDEFRNQN